MARGDVHNCTPLGRTGPCMAPGTGGVHYGTATAQLGRVFSAMHCDYCGQPATARIPATAGEVCLTHAILFWTGFLAYAKDHRPARA